MSRRSFALIVALVTLLVAAPVEAITNGAADGGTHPNVGALIVDYSEEEGAIVWCSGTLVAPTIFLTAAHCVDDPPEILGVSFEDEPISKDDEGFGTVNGPLFAIDGDPIPHPDFPGPSSDPHDLAVILLAAEPVGITPAALPTPGQFDELAQQNGLHDKKFTSVGYGSTGREHEPGSGTPTFAFPDTRMYAVSTFRALNNAWLRLSMNPSTDDDGGGCYGDSGGPNFLGVTSGPGAAGVLAGITITGDAVCRATNVVYRLDTPSARQFLAANGVPIPPDTTAAPAPKETAKADKGKAKKASKDRKGQKRRGHRR